MAINKSPARKKPGAFDFLKRHPMEFEFKDPGRVNPAIRMMIPKPPSPQPRRQRRKQFT